MEHRGACSVCKSLGERAWGEKREAQIVFSVDCRNQDNVKLWTVLTNAICLSAARKKSFANTLIFIKQKCL
jgi:hypothetical protein